MTNYDHAVVAVQFAAQRDYTRGVPVWQIIHAAIIDLMTAAAVHLGNIGPEKKQAVLVALGLVVGALPLPWWAAFALPLIRRAVLWIADGAIEVIYQRYKERFA